MSKRDSRLILVACLWLALLAALTACQRATPAPPAPVTVQLPWTHQAQFAGFYVADQQGYYAAEGLAVAFVQGGPAVSPVPLVETGAAQFGVTNGDTLILARANGKPLRAIATLYRRSPRAYAALASSGITRPQDFVGKTIQVASGGVPLLRAITTQVGLSPDQYRVVEATSDLTPFYTGQVDVRAMFLTNEVLTAQRAGYQLNIIYPDDYGVHLYADTLFTTDDLIASDPDRVRRFLAATLKGWTYAVENSATIGPLVQKYAAQADAALETAKMTASIPLVNTGEDAIGWMKPEMWAGMEATLRRQGVLTTTLDVTQVYTMQFVQEIYGK